jgi:uncharacterized membrane protein
MTIVRRRNTYEMPAFNALTAFSGSALIGALITDVSYTVSEDFIWNDASDWLVTIGAVVGSVALLAALLDLLILRRTLAPPWRFTLACFVAWVLSIANMFVHTQDSYTSVYPWGLALSAITALMIVIALWVDRPTIISESLAEERLA